MLGLRLHRFAGGFHLSEHTFLPLLALPALALLLRAAVELLGLSRE
jgi:hypothetical protein